MILQRKDVEHIHTLVSGGFHASAQLMQLRGDSRQEEQLLRQALQDFERATVELRKLYERSTPIQPGVWHKPSLPVREVTGYVEMQRYSWLHICLKTLLPSSAYQVPEWFSDSIRRLLDDYESGGSRLPYFKQALMVIEERSAISGRKVFDQDNKAWKAVSNAIKGRLIPDDDQYSLGIALMSSWSSENVCHITLLDNLDAADYFSFRSENCWF